MKEIWKDIKNYEGIYQISNYGRIKGFLLYNRHTKKYMKKETLLKPCKTNKGYLRVTLCKNKKHIRKSIHRLVAETFIEKQSCDECVNHIDGNKENNRVDNLEWCTYSYNEKHAYKTGLKNKKYGKDNPSARPVIQYDLHGNFLKEFDTVQEAHEYTKIAVNTIIRSCKQITKRHSKFIFKYKEV